MSKAPDTSPYVSPTGLGSPAGNWSLTWRLLKLAWRFRLSCLKVLTLHLLLMALSLSGLGLIGLGVDVVNYGVGGTSAAPKYPLGLAPPAGVEPMLVIAVIAGLVLAVSVLRGVLTFAATVAASRLSHQQIHVRLRADIYDKLQRLSFRFFDANSSGSIINRVTSDTGAISQFVSGVLLATVELVISLAFYLAYMLSIHPLLTAACLATTPALWLLTLRFSRLVKPAYRRNRELRDAMITRLAENVQGVHVVKGFARQRQEIDLFQVANDHVTNQQWWIFRKLAFFHPVIGMLTQVNLVVLLLYGGYLYLQHLEDPTQGVALGTGLVVFAGLLQQFSGQISQIGNISNTVQVSLTAAQRVFEILDAPIEIASPPRAAPLPRARGSVTFEGVEFAYSADGPAVLSDVSFHVEPGQCVAVVGATGAGKSTLLSLIPRFYDPRKGVVRVDGRDVREYDLDDLRRNIGLVFQESFLFSNTVSANIAFGCPDAGRERIEKAARIAAAHDFIVDLPRGYATVLTEGGANLSGGQRQRLAIARAILLEPAILILDDPTAAVDPETEHEILEAMDNAMKDRTTFVVAHRLSTLRRADLVIVLERGRIVETGTHEELMARKGHYRSAARLQIADAQSLKLLGMEG